MNKYATTLLSALALLAALPALAQAPAGPTVTELSLERTLVLDTTLVSGNLNIPPGALQGVTSGALQVRERLIYNPAGATLTSTLFTVQTGSPLPTPINANIGDSLLGVYALSIEKIYATTRPANSLAFTGTVTSATNNGVLGDVVGTPFVVSMGYAPESDAANAPLKVSELVHLMAGKVVVYTKDAAGTLVVPAPPPTTPPGAGPEIVIVAPTNTIDRQITLDASGTTDASGTSLTFAWRIIGKTASILNPNTATPIVQFAEGLGDYVFEVTVTNGNGVSAKKTVTVTYYGR